ncbi:MAG TPA: hypothetical protein VK914_07840 [bacterium]|jgi:hypothetical protein|nr:hypothetical protein [bacterium]
MAAFLEAVANRILMRSGFTVDEVEPDLSGQGLKGRPDFLATHSSCGQIIVEVRSASTADDQVRFEDRTISEVMAGLNQHLQPPEWLFSVGVVARQGGGIPFAKLADSMKKQMRAFSAAGVTPQPFILKEPTVTLQITPQPTSPGRVSVWSGGWVRDTFQVLTIVDRLRKVLGQKGSKYGTPSQPMVLVVGLDGYMETGQEEIMSALLGRQTLTFQRRADGSHETWAGRDDSGLFGTDTDPQFTRISGILFICEWSMQGLAGQLIQPKWTFQKPRALYVTNPHAARPATDLFANLPVCKLSLAPGGGVAHDWKEGDDLVDFLLS